MPSHDALRAAIAAFDGAARSLEACRILLEQILEEIAPAHPAAEETLLSPDRPCSHPEAIEVTTLGDRAPVWLCPGCGESFQ